MFLQVFVHGSRLKSALREFTGEKDPCFSSPTPLLLGVSRVYLDSLQYGFHINVTTPIMDFKVWFGSLSACCFQAS